MLFSLCSFFIRILSNLRVETFSCPKNAKFLTKTFLNKSIRDESYKTYFLIEMFVYILNIAI